MFHSKMSGMMFGYAPGGGKCALGEQFKNVGPAGPKGATGPRGDITYEQGKYVGATGPTGENGLRGETGLTGSTGPKGDTGFAFSPTTLQVILPVTGTISTTSGGNVTGTVTDPSTLVQSTIGTSGFPVGQGVYFLDDVLFGSSIVLNRLQIYYIKTLNPSTGYVTVSLTSAGSEITW